MLLQLRPRLTFRVLGLVGALAASSLPALGGCGGSDADTAATAATGDLGQPCYPNDTCNKPFACVAQVCVDDGGAGGQAGGGAGIGGKGGAAGTSGASTGGTGGGGASTGGAGGSTGGSAGSTGSTGGSGGSAAGTGGTGGTTGKGGSAGTASGGKGGAAGANGGSGGSTAGSGGTSAGGTGGSSGGMYPSLAVAKITGATAAEIPMIAEGVALANETMKTPCFKQFVLSAKWTETNGLTQAQIWDKLCSGPVTIDVDMFLGTWYQNNISKTIGYEDEPGLVHMNRYFVDTAYMVADNLIHEAEGHSQGFSHYGVKATSVPYGLNDAFEACSPVGP